MKSPPRPMSNQENRATALQQFAQTLHEKFSAHVVGEPEDQLRAPFEQLLSAAGLELGFRNVLPIGETALANIGRPDYGVALNKLLCGHVELKAPGKEADTAKLKGHDKAQWERFKNLPNILYSDGQAFEM